MLNDGICGLRIRTLADSRSADAVARILKKLKMCIAAINHLTCRVESYSVTCHLTHVYVNPSQTGRYSIYLPGSDRRLSWPRRLVIYRDTCTQTLTVTHPSSSRIRRLSVVRNLELRGRTQARTPKIDAEGRERGRSS